MLTMATLFRQVPEDEDKKGKPGFINFKRAVWHASFRKILERLVPLGKTGQWFKCGDDVTRRLYPIILLLSADYEEQQDDSFPIIMMRRLAILDAFRCTMVLNRGPWGLYPCCVCEVPKDEQDNLSITHPSRNMEAIKAIVLHPTMLKTAKDALLKAMGLRYVKVCHSVSYVNLQKAKLRSQNVFWEIPRLNPYRAVSGDPMHANDIGLYGNHIWPEVQSAVDDLGRDALATINHQ